MVQNFNPVLSGGNMNPQSVGWDIHRKFSTVTLAEKLPDGQMRVIERAQLEHIDRKAMKRWLSRVKPGTPVALEAAFGWPWVADLLEQAGLEPHLAHPPAVKQLAKYEAKGDRCDADRLVKFQLRGILPESYLAPPEVRQIRERTRYRMALAKIRSGVKNRIHAILHRHGIIQPYSDLFGKEGQVFLEKLKLPEASWFTLTRYVRLLAEVTAALSEVEAWMVANLPVDSIVRLLMTIPGIGLILAHVIRAEIGEISRFPSRRYLSSYSGLAPLSDDSADRHGPRHCSQACNHVLRWALIEAAGAAVRQNNQKGGQRLRRLYWRLTHGGKDCKSQAKVAVARELSELVYVIWTKGQAYTETPPPRPGTAKGAAPHTVATKRTVPKTSRGCAKSETSLSNQLRPQPDAAQDMNPARVAQRAVGHEARRRDHASNQTRSDQPRHPMVRPKRVHAEG
jgi:transposase